MRARHRAPLPRLSTLGALLLLPLLCGLAPPSAAAADPLPSPSRVVDLRVEGGGGWRAENLFWLGWDLYTPDGAAPIVAVNYLVRSASHPDAEPARRLPGRATQGGPITLPESGRYLAEVWAEDGQGRLTPRATVALRLDRARPAAVEPLLPGGWIGAGAVQVRVTHPASPLPLSGLRGYAISIDGDPAGSPCASPERCDDAEVDLRQGVGGDWLLLPGLPQGTVYVHAVAVSGSGMRSAHVGTALAHVDATPPRLTLDGVPAGWARGPVRAVARAGDALSGMAASGGAFTAIAVDGGVPATAPGGTVAAVVGGNGIHRVESYARDAAGNVNAGRGPGDPPATATVRIDGIAPRVAFAERGDPADPERLEATVSDPLSGPSATRGTIGVRPARSHRRFEPLPTAVAEGRLVARWDSDSYPPGSYEFQAIGYDRAGNAGRGGERANGTRMVLANPVKTRTVLQARIDRRSHRARTAGRRGGGTPAVAGGRGARLSGRLLAGGRTPLSGQEVRVVESFDAGASPERRLSTARTGPDGSFAVRLAPGPSRVVEVSFAGTPTLGRTAAPPLRLEARGRVRMRASARSARVGGAPVLFSGRVGAAGATLPAEGLPVALQFRLPGLRWSEFRTVSADRHGRFRYRYAFADDDSRGVRFQFRAVVAAQAGWPYATGASKPIAVTGR